MNGTDTRLRRPAPGRRRPLGGGRDIAWLTGLTVVLVVVFAWPGLLRGWMFGPGPDGTVYVWWTRLGAEEGISLVGARPGVPALIAGVAGTLGIPLVPAIAGLQQALGVGVGLGAVALVHRRSRGGAPGWALAGLLAGVFAVHLAGGYVANLAFAVAFLAAGAGLARRTRRGVIAAALLLGGGGLAHPQFFLAGAVILVGAGLVALVRQPDHGWRSDVGRVAIAIGGGGLVVAGGLLATLAGPARLPVDTSKDGFLRRAGLTDALTRNYLARFRGGVRRFAPWVSLPLAAIGTLQVRGFTRRFLVAWAAFTVIGVPVGIATGWFPPERVVTFGFALPILAAAGITWCWERTEPRRWLTVASTVVLVGLFAVPALNAQRSQTPFISPEDLAAATLAGRIAQTLPPDTPLVFVVDDPDRFVTFRATNVANIARAAVAPERADDVFVFVGGLDDLRENQPTVRGEPEYDTLSRITLADLPEGPRATFVVPAWNPEPAGLGDAGLHAWTGPASATIYASVPDPRALPPAEDELAPATPAAIAGSALAVLAFLWVLGAGWSTWAFSDRVVSVAAAPAFGVAALTIAALAIERLGVPLGGRLGPLLASALAAGGGYGLAVLQRQTPGDAPSQVGQAPDDEHEHGRRDQPVPDP